MLMYDHKNIVDNISWADVANESVKKKKRPQTNIQTFLSELFIIYIRLSWLLGAFNLFILPIKFI